MTLEQLYARRAELEGALSQTSQSLFILQGHKNEVDYQISELLKVHESAKESAESVASSDEAPVE